VTKKKQERVPARANRTASRLGRQRLIHDRENVKIARHAKQIFWERKMALIVWGDLVAGVKKTSTIRQKESTNWISSAREPPDEKKKISEGRRCNSFLRGRHLVDRRRGEKTTQRAARNTRKGEDPQTRPVTLSF